MLHNSMSTSIVSVFERRTMSPSASFAAENALRSAGALVQRRRILEESSKERGQNSGKLNTRSSLNELLKGSYFLAEVILVFVRWYFEYELSAAISRALWSARSASITRPFFVGPPVCKPLRIGSLRG